MLLGHVVYLQKGCKRMGRATCLQPLPTTHHGQSLKLVFSEKTENKELRIIPALVKTIAEEENSAGRDSERLSRSSSYLSIRSAVPAVLQEDVYRPAVMEISGSL